METEKRIIQILELVLARQEAAAARQEKATEELKAAHGERKVAQAEMEARGEARQEKMKADITAKIESGHERFLAFLDGLTSYGKGTTTCRTETTSCPGEMVATRLEANPEETEAAVECQELQMEEADVDAVGSSQDRYGYQRLAVRRRQGAKKRSQDSVGSRQKSPAARKRVILRAVLAVRKEHMRKGPGKNNVA
jgi:hypothetical protein